MTTPEPVRILSTTPYDRGQTLAASTALALPGDTLAYERHRTEQTPLYALIEEHFPRFLERLDAEGVSLLPHFVIEEFEAYLECGRLEHGFLRVRCDACRHEKLVAFSCKHRGSCPRCGARRMADTAAHLVEHVLPEQPIRQWVLSLPPFATAVEGRIPVAGSQPRFYPARTDERKPCVSCRTSRRRVGTDRMARQRR